MEKQLEKLKRGMEKKQDHKLLLASNECDELRAYVHQLHCDIENR